MSRLRAPGVTPSQAAAPRPSAIDIAAAAWGPDVPDWIAALAAACDAAGSSQGAVAKRLGISRASVSFLLSKKYESSTDAMERRIRAVLMRAQVDCPVIAGRIPAESCLRIAARGYDPSNVMTVRFSRTCPTCANNPNRKRS